MTDKTELIERAKNYLSIAAPHVRGREHCQIIEALISALESPWVSVETELPEQWKLVLALYRWPHQARAKYGLRQIGADGDWYNENGVSTMSVSQHREPVTHWQPLPPPEEV